MDASHVDPLTPHIDADHLAEVHHRLLAWYDEHSRDLPWRLTRDPYAILVSEVMLQQIQVVRAIPFYHRFLERFPTIAALAAAPVSEVLHTWGDLGLYRRATNLHTTAKRIVAEFGGRVPEDVATLQSFPGIGPYTAGAIACFAYEQDVGFLDTNARRVIHRIFVGSDVPVRTATNRALSVLANSVVPTGDGWRWNQAVIELGALVCKARRPACTACPVHEACAAHATIGDAVATLPKLPKAAKRSPVDGSHRIYRGKVLARLRANTEGYDLPTLGRDVRTDFSDADLPWLSGVVESLQRDGLALIAEERPRYDAGATSLDTEATPDYSTEPSPVPGPWVRLPD